MMIEWGNSLMSFGKLAIWALVLALYSGSIIPPAFAGTDPVGKQPVAQLQLSSPTKLQQTLPLTLDEFRQLASELAPKVNLFRRVWAQDPNAQFYGGTSRDFLYWILKQFDGVTQRDQVEAKLKELRSLPSIHVRDFISWGSDIDVLTHAPKLDVSPEEFGVKKVDAISRDRLDPASELGRSEILQGYIPAEKIVVGKSGIVPQGAFGDGVREIYEGKLTVHFSTPEEFASTHYAKQKLNHPILLALRYLRLQAMNTGTRHSHLIPEDPEVSNRIRSVVQSALSDPEFKKYLGKDQFKKWLNGTIQKTFRFPDEAQVLMKEYGVDKLVTRYGLDPINQYLFAKKRDPYELADRFRQYGVKEEDVLINPVKALKGSTLSHGTKSEQAFRSILFEGVLPSASGSAGEGLYAVPVHRSEFAAHWGKSKDRVVDFQVKPEARFLDMTRGPGQELKAQFFRRNPGASLEQFCDFFGIDILRYPYLAEPEAVVVKNSSVLEAPQGHTRKLLSFSKILEQAESVRDLPQYSELLKTVELNGLDEEEHSALMQRLKYPPGMDTQWKQLSQSIEEAKFPPGMKTLAAKYLMGIEEVALLTQQDPKSPKLQEAQKSFFSTLDRIVEFPGLGHDQIKAFAKSVSDPSVSGRLDVTLDSLDARLKAPNLANKQYLSTIRDGFAKQIEKIRAGGWKLGMIEFAPTIFGSVVSVNEWVKISHGHGDPFLAIGTAVLGPSLIVAQTVAGAAKENQRYAKAKAADAAVTQFREYVRGEKNSQTNACNKGIVEELRSNLERSGSEAP
jgi:hypothetical protein